MSRILRVYTLREIIFPTLVAAVALTFIILIGTKTPWNRDELLIFTLLKFGMRKDVAASDILAILFYMLPTILRFITPMALLVGIIVGVGRMTLDLEVRAMQTGGINLLSIFVPVIGVGMILSAWGGYFTYGPEPRIMSNLVVRGGKLLVSEFTHLEAGRVYQKLFPKRSGVDLYFDSRDEATGDMQGVTMMVEHRAMQENDQRAQEKMKMRSKLAELRQMLDEGGITKEEYDRQEYDMNLAVNKARPMMIFASKAKFDVSLKDAALRLVIQDGSLHMFQGEEAKKKASKTEDSAKDQNAEQPEPKEKTSKDEKGESPLEQKASQAKERAGTQYTVIRFDKLTKTETAGEAGAASRQLKTTPELQEIRNDSKLKDKVRWGANATIIERYALAFESFIYALIGLPLAIWIRPTGKSFGVVISAGIIFVYHFLSRTGVTMVEGDKPFGSVMIFAPNIIFAAGSVGLWWRAVRR